ncbi:hypothetical protein ABW20_dc0109462 [Dactylellina cionopaga]|nr:hypothetical protein ABW20_dc0109462 [Dactylellina cionopaga]
MAGRLIVHIHDHRTTAKDADGASVKPKNNHLFSLNRWNEHLTPSPFVPYPVQKSAEVKEEPITNGETKPMDIDTSSSKLPEDNSKRVFKTVLHPTPASLHAEICLLAITPAVPPKGRHNSVVQTPATPASAHPLTVSTAPPPKPLPTILNDKTALTFEADYLLTTGPSLVLTPAESPEHASAILEALAHPLHSRPVPPKKTRKRTVKEMAVDEAKAAEEERLMLIMDERHQASAIGATDDGPVGSGGFEPSFKRWKALESIKQKHVEEKLKKEQEKLAQAEKDRQNAVKDQQVRVASEPQTRPPTVASTPTQQSPLEGRGTLRDMIARGGATQLHLQQQAAARDQAVRDQIAQREQAQAQAQAAREQVVQAQAQAQAQAQQVQAAQAAREQANHQAHAVQVAAQAQAQVAAQTPTSAPQQTSAPQGSPIAAASSPYAHQGSPPMQSRTSNHSSQPGSRQQSPHMSTVQSIQHQHSQPIPGSPAMHASPMMRATSQAMHNSPAMNQGSPLARNIAMVGGQHMTPAQLAAHQMMMTNARNQNAMNMAKNAGQHMQATPEQQKVMMQRAIMLQQQQLYRQQQMLASQAQQQHQHQQHQQHQHAMMEGMGGAGGMHPAMVGRGFMGGVANGGMHMNGMMGNGMQMAMNGYPQMMIPNGMGGAGGMQMGMMNGAALQGYNPAQINMLMAARGRGQPPQGQ